MNKKIKLILVLLAMLLPFQYQALAETSQGTITSIDSSGSSFNLLPPQGDAETAYVVNVRTAPGAQYTGGGSFDALQVGDYVEINALSKSKTGSTLEATHISRRFAANENVHFDAAMTITQTTLTTTTPAVVSVPVVATTFKTTETMEDGKTTVTQSKSTTIL